MASGSSLILISPHSNQPPSASYATFNTRNSHLVLEFTENGAADEGAVFPVILPRNYAGGGVTVRIAWLAKTATSGDVVWSAEWERHDDDTTDLDSDSFAAAQTVTATTSSGSGETKYSDIAFTHGAQMDSISAGESGRLRIKRLSTNGADTLSGVAQCLRIEVRES